MANTLNLTFGVILAIAATFNLLKIFARDLMMLQQNSYRKDRYMRWFAQSGESTNIGRIFCCIGLFFLLIERIPFFASAIVVSIIAIWQLYYLSTRKYKKPLVWTARARRIYVTMVALSAASAMFPGIFFGYKIACIVLMLVSVVSPIILLLANDILVPVEKSINRKYYNEAASILQSMSGLKVIGITGSYGKTSTKHYLNRILQEQFSTTMTPGSFNTTLGVIRTIREHLKPYDEVFIVEMGAKQLGDIKEICDLVHPSMGIITAVGEQHLESFKSIENVQHTKFELADSLPSNGVVIVNNDFPYAANRKVLNANCIHYGIGNKANADYIATEIAYTPYGTDFAIEGSSLDKPLRLHTKLVGECNVSNLLAAIIVALKLNVPIDKIKYAVGQIEQVEHRLNIKRTPGGVTIIDDAFNSNPHGSKMALEVLSMMKPGKRIVVTPGMIELGSHQEQANTDFGKTISRCADVAIIVGQYNRQPIMNGLTGNGSQSCNTEIHAVDSFAEAQKLLASILQPGDTVLYENDLPDTFK